MTPAEMKKVHDAHIAAENRQDVEAALATYHEACFLEPVQLGIRLQGKPLVSLAYAAAYQAFPDAVFRIDGEAFGEETMAVWGVVTATMRREWMGLPPTGRRVEYPMVSIIPFEDELMAGERQFSDLASWCDQLGLSIERVRSAFESFRA